MSPFCIIKSDQHKNYPEFIQRYFPKAEHESFKSERGCVAGQGELKKTKFDPIFNVNHTLATLRDNVSTTVRRSWCVTQSPVRLQYHVKTFVRSAITFRTLCLILCCIYISLCYKATMLNSLNYTDFLKVEFEQRRLGNSSYSLRAFARDLEFSPSRLSEVLNDRGKISSRSAFKIAEKLNLSIKEKEIFISLVDLKNSSAKKAKFKAQKYLDELKENNSMSLSPEAFSFVSEWYYFAIISTLELDNCNGTPDWISGRLDISMEIVMKALETLSTLGIVIKENNLWKLVDGYQGCQTTNEVTSIPLRKSHKQSLYQAIESIDKHEVSERDITSITMSIDKNKIPQAKKLIKEFRTSLCEFMESGKKNEVYNLNIQLVPVTVQEKEK